MPTPAFISIEGSNQGKITAGAFTEDSVGNVYVEGHEDEIMACLLYTSCCIMGWFGGSSAWRDYGSFIERRYG